MSTAGGADKQPSEDDMLGCRPPPYRVAMHAKRSSWMDEQC